MFFIISCKNEKAVIEVTDTEIKMANTSNMKVEVKEEFSQIEKIENTSYAEIKLPKIEQNLKKILKKLEFEE